MNKQIMIDVVSDVVCPWCYIGRKRLEQALDLLPELDVAVHWRPFQLDPAIPQAGKDRKAYLKEKLGGQARVDEIHDQLIKLGEEDGIEFDFDAIEVAPNTLDAHRVIQWASQAGPEVQDRLVGKLFSFYFEQGLNIGDHEVLVDAASASGMDGQIVASLLATDADRESVLQEIETASRIGVRGVPCFIIDQKYAVMGAQSADVLADAIRQAADGFEPGLAEDR